MGVYDNFNTSNVTIQLIILSINSNKNVYFNTSNVTIQQQVEEEILKISLFQYI